MMTTSGPNKQNQETEIIDLNMAPPDIRQPVASQFPPPIFDKEEVSLEDLKSTGLPIDETIFLAVGGGLGSYAWVDHLVIYGAKPADIVVIGMDETPYAKYQRLCENSRIPTHERLRSHSSSTPDNIWGWPGYAVREIFTEVRHGNLEQALKILWRIFGEPVFDQTYTPVSGKVFASIKREVKRIGWDKIWRYGSVRAIRKTTDGRYVVAYSQTRTAGQHVHKLIIARYVHIAVGYPAIRILPDLQKYREDTQDFQRVVNAYEPHQHVYDHLTKHGGTIMLRGRGIVASRILQQIYELREYNKNIGVVHLMRSPRKKGFKYGYSRRRVDAHWEFQPFNWPKSAWGGIQFDQLEQADVNTRAELVKAWEGSTTADRHDWRRMVRAGLDDGWYTVSFGEVQSVKANENNQVTTYIEGRANQPASALSTDFVIDATGLISGAQEHPLLNDLIETYKLPLNGMKQIAVTNQFEIERLCTEQGHVFAAGIATLGGPVAAVDSFLGLQISALRSVDYLARMKAPHVKYLNGFQSAWQWLKWVRGVTP